MMEIRRQIIVFGACGLLAGCAKEPPPPTVDEFVQDPILLEAAMVRCGQNRSSTKYEPECVNAREAINRIARADEEQRRANLEAESERKRRALRRTQEAAAEARRRAEEADRARREQEYLSQFGLEPGGSDAAPDGSSDISMTVPTAEPREAAPPNEPPAGDDAVPQTDLQSIRDELARDQEADPR